MRGEELTAGILGVEVVGRLTELRLAFGFDAFGFDGFGFDAFGFDAFGFDAFGFDAFGFEVFAIFTVAVAAFFVLPADLAARAAAMRIANALR
jgi:hypothetical protein